MGGLGRMDAQERRLGKNNSLVKITADNTRWFDSPETGELLGIY